MTWRSRLCAESLTAYAIRLRAPQPLRRGVTVAALLLAAATTPASAQSAARVGSFVKTAGAAPATQTIPHNLGQTPSALILWTEGRTNETFSTAGGVGFRAATSAGAASGVLSLTIARPAATVVDDVMLAGIGVSADSPTITAPAGWTLVRQTNQTNTTRNALAVFQRIATASEPATYTWTFSASAGAAGGIAAFSGADVQDPIDVELGQTNNNSTSQPAPSVTTTAANEMVVTFHTMASAATWTPPAGMTEAIDVASGGLGAAGQSLQADYVQQATAGATGTKTATASNNRDRGNGQTIALRPALPNYFGIGMTDGTNSGSVATAVRTGVVVPDAARRVAAQALTIAKWDQTVLAEASLQSWNASDFVLNWTTNDAGPYVIHYLAIGGTGVQARVVNWQMRTSPGPQLVAGFGFQPSAVIHIHANSGLTGAPPSMTGAGGFGMGVVDSAGSQWATSTFSNPASPTDTQRGQQTNATIYAINNATSVAKNAAFTSWSPDGFNLNYSTASALAGQVFTLGLSGVNLRAGSFAKTTAAAPANQSVTGLGFQPQAILLHSFQDIARATPVAHNRFGLGVSDGSVTGGSVPIAGSSAYADADNVAVSAAQGIDKISKVFMKVNNATSTIDAEAHVASIEANGFTLNWTTNDAVATQMLYLAIAPLAPTEVRLLSFTATRYDAGTLLQWRTGYEIDNLGFHLYREVDGVRTRITDTPVSGTGLLAGAGTAVNAEQSYARWDVGTAGSDAVTYWLEDIDFSGTATLHGPVTPLPGGSVAPSTITPSTDLRDLNRRVRNRRVFMRRGESAARPLAQPATIDARAALAAQQALAAGAAVKIGVRTTGWYRVGQAQLLDAGLPPAVDPRLLRLFVDGVEQAMTVTGEADGHLDAGDAVEFLGIGADTPHTDTRTYWLAAGSQPGRRMAVRPAPAGVAPAAGSGGFWSTVRRKDRSIYFAALVNGDAENWFGSLVSADPLALTLGTEHRDPTAASAELAITLQGVTSDPHASPDHRIAVQVNGADVGEMTFDGQANSTQTFAVPASLLNDGETTVTLVARGSDADFSLVDTVRLSYWHTYEADADQLWPSVQARGRLTISGFASPRVRVVDVTAADAPVEWLGTVTGMGNGLSSVTVRVPAAGSRQLFAFSDLTVKQPAFVIPNQPSAWWRSDPGYDYVLIAASSFAAEAAPLAALRTSQGYRVAVVDVADVYDEFSYGEKRPQALTDFLRSARATWRTPPRFVVLLGDATIDPRDYAGQGDADFVPTMQVGMSTVALETASDDALVDFDGDGSPELSIGRLSARTRAQASAIVAKVVGYDAADDGPWTRSVLLIADAVDQTSDFEAFTDRLAVHVPADYVAHRIDRGAVGPTAARDALRSRVDDGQLIVNFAGHGSVQIWGRDGELLTNTAVAAWRNAGRLPFVVAMNCLNGLFTQVWDEESLAESLQRTADGGAVAVWASSAVTSSATQAIVNEELFRLIFTGAYATIGEAVSAAKRVVDSPDLRRSWIFFGDPATRLAGAPRPATTATPAAPGHPAGWLDDAAPVDGEVEFEAGAGDRGHPVRLPDLDGDGRDDMMTYDGGSGGWRVRFDHLAGARVMEGRWDVGWRPVTADLNGDGRRDVLFTRPGSADWVQGISTGPGAFVFTRGVLPVAASARAQVVVGDFDGDNREDALVYEPIAGRWTLATSDGRGGFIMQTGRFPSALQLQVAHLDTDRRADIVGYDAASGAGLLAASLGGGRFAMTAATWEPGWTVTAARLDARAGAELLFYDRRTGAWAIRAGGRTDWRVTRRGRWPAGLALQAVDLDGQALDDIIGYDRHSGSWMTAVRTTTGGWATRQGVWTPGWSMATGDLNGDGRADAILLDPASGVAVRALTVAPGVFAYESADWVPGARFVGRP